MSLLVRTVRSQAEYAGAFGTILQYFGREPLSDAQAARSLTILPFERMHAAFDGAQVVGGAGAFRFNLTVPGGELPCAGVTLVGVAPTHRRRGALTGMMRAQLDACRAGGEPLAALWASEETIYGRFGYGVAAWDGELSLPREHAAFAKPFTPRGKFRLVSAQEALAPATQVYARARSQRAGMLSRTPEWWNERRLGDFPERREPGAGPKRIVLLELDGEVQGHAIYRHHPKWEQGFPAATTDVFEAFAQSREAERELWRYLLDLDLAATIVAPKLALDHPLLQLLAQPRYGKFRVGDSLWLRLVDVGAALSGRSYRPGGPVVFEVKDAFCPWNEGRWRLSDGTAERTDAAADLALDVDALAAAYLGGVSFRALADGLRVEERTPGAIANADLRFHTDRLPWCPEMF
jgi:predicted acetyltransferase